MDKDIRSLDWSHAIDALSKHLHPVKPLRFGDSGDQALVLDADSSVMAIIKVYPDENFLSLHIRASCIPSLSAYIAAIVSTVAAITVDEMFDYNYTGDMLTGNEALSFAADNIRELWFGFEKKKTGKHNDRPNFLN